MSRPVTPAIAADTIIRRSGEPAGPIVLIERKNPPYGWALPGGFVDVGETVAAAAVREALEETRSHVTLTALLGCYSDPSRDARGHTVGLVYVAETDDEPAAADDAAALSWFELDALPSPLCFDHATILEDYRQFLQTGAVAPLDR